MTNRPSLLKPLKDEQLQASDPSGHVWLSASAGTGKTHVLTARVLRLLLNGAVPSAILCLTFTKAGAAEMADRIHARLAAWVRMRERDVREELFSLGEPNGPEEIAEARTLFARVLDAGGGLRIQTIHAFSQTLLAGFPIEAGLTPGFRPLEGREESALARATLGQLLMDAEASGNDRLLCDVQTLSLRLGEGGAETYLMQCARAAEAMALLGVDIEGDVRRALGVPAGDVEAAIAEACADGRFDCDGLTALGQVNAAWGTKSGLARADVVARWLAGSAAERTAILDALHGIWARADGEPRSFGKGQAPQDEGYGEHALRFHGEVGELLAIRARATLAALIAAGLRSGQAFARAYAEAKRSGGLVDFDDLIRSARGLLLTPGMGEWVRYKLDQATDHILVDEAQDTNARQWEIVAALASEFFAGSGAKGEANRTIFTVGDFKQAIFGFQGTDPDAFRAAARSFSARAEEAERPIASLSLARSFRSTPPVLELVDRLIDELGAERLGLDEDVPRHVSARDGLPGTVTLWRPHTQEQPDGDDEADGEEGWIDDATRAFATKLARQIKAWLTEPLMLEGQGRPLKPEDVLVLVRRRGALASLLVARLHAEGVPVAGVDRLRLTAPLAVRDLLAAVRFALQPEDDLTLASLLVSPLFAWSQDALYAVAKGERPSLITVLRREAGHGATLAGLNAILNAADFTTPYRFLEAILSGPLDGRAKLLRRLGEEARDPIEELLNAALRFEGEATPSLQRFVDWFDRGEVEIVRDPSAPLDAVRVMTVHGSKGLQAPLVVLADATGDPEAARASSLGWPLGEGLPVPVLRPRGAEMVGTTLAEASDAAKRRDLAEHWRLLYVAATRAEERLVIGGALSPRMRGTPPELSWYTTVERAMASLGAEWTEDALWGAAREHSGGTARPVARTRRVLTGGPAPEPEWLRAAAPAEARPPRPLAPSSLGPDRVAEPPPSPGMRIAARRGELLHALFERLPGIAEDLRVAAAEGWLAQSAGVEDAGERAALVRDACAIISDPKFAALFGRQALAEAPIAAVVNGEVIAGTVDRLLVSDGLVRVVDFKTGRRVPASVEAAPEHHLRQMAAYAAALRVIFPEARVEAALLYTSGPRLLPLTDALLATYKPGLGAAEQNPAGAG